MVGTKELQGRWSQSSVPGDVMTHGSCSHYVYIATIKVSVDDESSCDTYHSGYGTCYDTYNLRWDTVESLK